MSSRKNGNAKARSRKRAAKRRRSRASKALVRSGGKNAFVNYAWKNRRKMIQAAPRLYYDMVQREGSLFRWCEAIANPAAGSAQVPQFSGGLPTIPVTGYWTSVMTTDVTYGTAGILLDTYNMKRHWLGTITSAGVGTWDGGANVFTTEPYAHVRPVSAQLRLTYIGKSTEDDGYGRIFIGAPSFTGTSTEPSNVDFETSRTLSRYIKIGEDVCIPLTPYDPYSLHFQEMTAAGIGLWYGMPSIAIIIAAGQNNAPKYRVEMTVNYESIPLHGYFNAGTGSAVVQTTAENDTDISAQAWEAVTQVFEGLKGTAVGRGLSDAADAIGQTMAETLFSSVSDAAFGIGSSALAALQDVSYEKVALRALEHFG